MVWSAFGYHEPCPRTALPCFVNPLGARVAFAPRVDDLSVGHPAVTAAAILHSAPPGVIETISL